MKTMMAKPEMQKQAKLVTEHLQQMGSNPKLQEQAKFVAKLMEAMGHSHVAALRAEEVSRNSMVNKLVDNMAGEMFNVALKVAPQSNGDLEETTLAANLGPPWLLNA